MWVWKDRGGEVGRWGGGGEGGGGGCQFEHFLAAAQSVFSNKMSRGLIFI